ncbi:hypothetical protein JDV02_001363 [Purpureocillium takamizusanense]|uniref:Killer toxin Kp4 domain-containing protein n=1 Tax=Purpureocillium takamizusanense TaxID=2060973 RepID=A0A9Q8V6D5_9HYPO|nr:uncharacterized protein JDV02_001363 [Purpureocillium takamizusanense]UNI14765.1 hypothetical protein JDV02_001363 [Purpureocillium takamizusanense]
MRPSFATVLGLVSLGLGRDWVKDPWKLTEGCFHVSYECEDAQTVAGRGDNPSVAEYIARLVDKLPEDTVYKSGEHIICYQYSNGPAGFCLFFEGLDKGATRNKRDIKAAIPVLLEVSPSRECKGRCGEARAHGDTRNGLLKLDYVGEHSCEGIC